MDIATFVGLVLGAILIAMAILVGGGSFASFVDYPSLMVVVGGAFSALLIAFPLKNVLSAFKVVKNAFFNRHVDTQALIELVVSLAETARRDGLLALENKIDDIDNPFVVMGIQMAVDGTQPEVIEDIMRNELEAVATRHRDGKGLFDQMGRFAPAFGMIGTLMGLIMMLSKMDDPSTIGQGMAVALITTLYGAVVANLVCIPLAEKLGFLSKKELLAMEIIIRGIMSIQSGDNPRVIEQKLNTFVPPKLRSGAQEEAA